MTACQPKKLYIFSMSLAISAIMYYDEGVNKTKPK